MPQLSNAPSKAGNWLVREPDGRIRRHDHVGKPWTEETATLEADLRRLKGEQANAVFQRTGLRVQILRPAERGDCSLNGISNRYPDAVIVGVRYREASGGSVEAAAVKRGLKALPRIFAASQRAAEVELVVRQIGGGLYVHAEPVEGNGRWAMFGGCYIDTSDSRFGELLHAIYGDNRSQVGPIPLHDRYES